MIYDTTTSAVITNATPAPEVLPQLVLYLVRNRKGKWFRAKGYEGSGDSWVEDINKARIYTKLAQARGRRTFFATNYPDFGVPDIVELIVIGSRVIDDVDAFEKAKKKKEREQQLQQERAEKYEIERIEARLKEDNERLQRLKKPGKPIKTIRF
jgi:hypothetical protein